MSNYSDAFAWLRDHYRPLRRARPRPSVSRSARSAAVRDDYWRVLRSPVTRDLQRVQDPADAERPADRDELGASAALRSHTLSLDPVASLRLFDGQEERRRHFQFEVVGLPQGHQAWIALCASGWRVLLAINGEPGEWSATHATKEVALARLSRDRASTGPARSTALPPPGQVAAPS